MPQPYQRNLTSITQSTGTYDENRIETHNRYLIKLNCKISTENWTNECSPVVEVWDFSWFPFSLGPSPRNIFLCTRTPWCMMGYKSFLAPNILRSRYLPTAATETRQRKFTQLSQIQREKGAQGHFSVDGERQGGARDRVLKWHTRRSSVARHVRHVGFSSPYLLKHLGFRPSHASHHTSDHCCTLYKFAPFTFAQCTHLSVHTNVAAAGESTPGTVQRTHTVLMIYLSYLQYVSTFCIDIDVIIIVVSHGRVTRVAKKMGKTSASECKMV